MAKLNLIKKVRSDLYFRIDQLTNSNISLSKTQKKAVRQCLSRIKTKGNWNLCRLSKDSISFMEYNWNKPNPTLIKSIKLSFSSIPINYDKKIRYYKNNPPILHRCEIYFPVDSIEHEYYSKYGKKFR